MAPDRGGPVPYEPLDPEGSDQDESLNGSRIRGEGSSAHERREVFDLSVNHAMEPQNFTIRGVIVGLVIGVVICFSNMYFGLQTGWVSSMAMPSALIGFAYFKVVARHLSFPFSPEENVLVQSVAGSVGTMPLGCGFVGVLPALNFMLKPEENGPLNISLWSLIVWAVGICFFGVVFAVPLRRQVIIREKLKFPSGTATALMIGVLHGNVTKSGLVRHDSVSAAPKADREEQESQMADERRGTVPNLVQASTEVQYGEQETQVQDDQSDWKASIRLLIRAFALSAFYTLVSYFIPQLRHLPVLGIPLARNWLWTLNPSPAYVGQGIIMGPATTLHMLLGAIIGWGILSPLAKKHGWAPGPVSDWETGSKGWIVWVSLAIMLADALVSLGWLVLRPLIGLGRTYFPELLELWNKGQWRGLAALKNPFTSRYSALRSDDEAVDDSDLARDSLTRIESVPLSRKTTTDIHDTPEVDAPASHLISNRVVIAGLILSLGISIVSVHYTFANLIAFPLTLLALLLALILSIMGVRALGETDINPVSGISKLTQLVFAVVVPPHNKNAVIINLIAGALSESGALQAGDLLQDLKTGHLLGAAPSAQFYGQIIGSAVGAVVSALVYKWYTHVYEIPGGLFQVPTGYVWIFTARLVTGKGLPAMVAPWALAAGLLFAAVTVLRTWGKTSGVRWPNWVPGGIAVAVGMYNVPSFTLARTIGGLVNWYWQSYRKGQEAPIIVLASGLILGEGLFSIVNLFLASLKVPHL